MMRWVSGAASPISATPSTGTPRSRMAASDSSVWLMVPSRVRAQSTVGSRQRASTSRKVRRRFSGTITPPAPSITR